MVGWKIIENESQVNFTIFNDKGLATKGRFATINGNINFDKNGLGEASFKITVKVSSLKTDDPGRDHHLMAAEYFDEKNFPLIEFTSKKIVQKEDSYLLSGILKIKGTEKEITIPFNFIEKDHKSFFEGSFKLDREALGIGSHERDLIKNEVSVDLHIPVSPI